MSLGIPAAVRASRAIVIASALLLAAASAAWARPGELDRSFARNGIATLSFAKNTSASAQAVALTRGQLIVVAGDLTSPSGSGQIVVARYTSAGRLDPRFGRRGIVRTTFRRGPTVAGVAVDGRGRIVVAGANGSGFVVVRYTSAGRLDPSFGSGGRVMTPFPNGQVNGGAVVLLPGGGIAVAGGVTPPMGTNQGFALARYSSSGRLVASFGSGGRVFTGFGAGGDTVAAHAIAFSNGKLVAAGLFDNPFTGGGAYALARYSAQSGRLDPTFSDDGKVSTLLGNEAAAQGVIVDPSGRTVAAGLALLHPGQGDRIVLTRYARNGAVDPSFGRGGIVATNMPGGDAGANAIARQSNGRLVVAGQALQPGGATSFFGLVRYLPNGRLDPAFGTAGIVVTRFGRGVQAAANSVVIQANGRIVVAGSAGSTFTLARYLG